MQNNAPLSTVLPLLRSRGLRVLLLAAPGIMGAVAALTIAMEPNVGLAVVLNVAAGVIISSALFLVVSYVARSVADDRISLVKAADEGHWKARARLLSIRNDEDGLYADWYFRLRLQEEIDRSTRYSARFSLLIARPTFVHNELDARATSGLYFDGIRRHLRRSDVPAILKDGSLAIMLPQTGREVAVRRRIIKALAGGQTQIGVAGFPEDGQQVEALLEEAARAVQELGHAPPVDPEPHQATA